MRNGRKSSTFVWCLALLSVLPLLGYSIAANGPTYQEYAHLSSGFLSSKTGCFHYFNVNPPLSQFLASLPAVLFGANSFAAPEKMVDMRIEQDAAERFIYANPDTHRALLVCGRLLCCSVTLLLFVLALRSLFDEKEPFRGPLSFVLCAAQPMIFGFLTIISPDMLGAAAGLCFIAALRKCLKNPSLRGAALSGLFLGLALLSKFTFVVFYPLYPFLWLLCRFRRWSDPKTLGRELFFLLTIFCVSAAVINIGYRFEGTGAELGQYRFRSELLSGYNDFHDIPRSGANRFHAAVLSCVPMPFPANFILGIDTQRLDFERGMSSYLRGRWSDHGWWYYYLYALLIKTPPGTILLFLLAIFCAIFPKGYNDNWREEMIVLLPGVVLVVFVSSQTGFSIHSRYIIPALPFFLVWISKVFRAFTPEIKARSPLTSRRVRCLAVVFLVWSVASALWVYPHCLAYFNELAAIIPTPEDKNYPEPQQRPTAVWQKTRALLDAGPLNGPRHLIDSNIDWGQDLFGLERWCKNHPEVKDIKTALYEGYPIEMTAIPSAGPPRGDTIQPGWYALSVNWLYGDEKHRRFLKYRPAAVIGYTIYVYHIPPQ